MSSRKWMFRVRHILEAIGEAARRVPEEIQGSHPDIPWSVMIGMRHVLVHDYDTVNISTLWLTIQQDLPPLVPKLQRILKGAQKE